MNRGNLEENEATNSSVSNYSYFYNFSGAGSEETPFYSFIWIGISNFKLEELFKTI